MEGSGGPIALYDDEVTADQSTAIAKLVQPEFDKGNWVTVESEKPQGPWSRELVKQIAMDIGKAAVHHLETMYPAAVAACPATMKLSLRNTIHNEIMAAIEVSDEGQVVARLRDRKEHRRKIKAAYKKFREPQR